MMDSEQLREIIDERSKDIPGCRGIVLISRDGLVQASAKLPPAVVDQVAAACSGMASLAVGLGRHLDGGVMLQTAVRMEQATVLLAHCGEHSVLAAVVPTDAQLGVAMSALTALSNALAAAGSRSRTSLAR